MGNFFRFSFQSERTMVLLKKFQQNSCLEFGLDFCAPGEIESKIFLIFQMCKIHFKSEKNDFSHMLSWNMQENQCNLATDLEIDFEV